MVEAGEGVYKKSIRSGKWFFLNILSQKLIGVVSFFILARLLVPGDYGVMAAIMLVLGLINQLTTVPFGDALTQRKGDIERYLDPLWTFEILRSAVVVIFIFFAGGSLANFFHLSGTDSILMSYSGLLVLISAFSNPRQIYFFKELDFFKVFIRDVVSQIAFVATAVCYALFIKASPLALFFGYAAQYFSGVCLSFFLHPVIPRFSARFNNLMELIGYSKWSYGQDLMSFLSSQLDRMVVGRLLSPHELGVYARSKDLSSTASSIVFTIFDKVGFAAFSKVQDRMDKVREGFLKSVDVVLIAAIPITVILLFEGGALVRILLGEKWLSLVVPLKIFALGNIFFVFNRIVSPVLNAIGRPDVNFKINAIQLALTLPSMYIGFRYFDFRGLSVSIVITWIIMLCYVVIRTRGILMIPKRSFYPSITSGFIACVGTLVMDLIFRSFRNVNTSTIIILVQVAILGAIYFSLLLWSSWKIGKGPYETLRSILRELGVLPQKC